MQEGKSPDHKSGTYSSPFEEQAAESQIHKLADLIWKIQEGARQLQEMVPYARIAEAEIERLIDAADELRQKLSSEDQEFALYLAELEAGLPERDPEEETEIHDEGYYR